jgi:hypothetical protein
VTAEASAGFAGTAPLLPLHPLQYEDLLRRALAEDLGLAGDLTTNAVVPAADSLAARIVARRDGCIAGLEVAARTTTVRWSPPAPCWPTSPAPPAPCSPPSGWRSTCSVT